MVSDSSPFDYQRDMSAFIYGQAAEYPSQWKCGPVIGPEIVAQIYRRNFYGGLEQHFTVHFPVTFRYLGDQGCRFVLRNMVSQQAPQSPIYAMYAARLPEFLLQFKDLGDDDLCQCAGMLAAIEFFISNATSAEQTLDVEMRHYKLFNTIKSEPIAGINEGAGLYTLAHLHPKVISMQSEERVTLQASV